MIPVLTGSSLIWFRPYLFLALSVFGLIRLQPYLVQPYLAQALSGSSLIWLQPDLLPAFSGSSLNRLLPYQALALSGSSLIRSQPYLDPALCGSKRFWFQHLAEAYLAKALSGSGFIYVSKFCQR